MDLHRSTAKADWESIPDAHRTSIQRVAAATHGIVTLPNIITLVGLSLVVYGIVLLMLEQFMGGLIALAIGRLLDIADGFVAQKTGTKSPLGEVLDAAVDKIGTILAFIAFYVAGITFWWLITLLLIPQLIIPIISFYKESKGARVHPTLIGKLSMATLWVSLGGLILVKALELNSYHPVAVLFYVISFISAILGFYALWQYISNRT